MESNQSTENETESSSEAAGLARGAAKTVNTFTKQVGRQVMGSIPKQNPQTVKVSVPKVPKSNIAKVTVPKRIKPIKKVATVSDKISTGLDVYDTYDYAASVVTEAEVKEKVQEKTPWRTRFKTIVAFSATFLKNSILGAAVFDGYDKTIAYFDSRYHRDDDETLKSEYTDVYSRTSVPQHFTAGAVGGTIHSFGTLGLMYSENLYRNGFQINRMYSYQSISTYSFLHTIHHSLAHAVLFSSYEFMKRRLFASGPIGDRDVSEEITSDYSHLVAIGTAGGLAGILQYVSSFYTERWLRVGEENTVEDWRKKNVVRVVTSGPTIRSVLMNFPPSAIGFIAFETGKEFISLYSKD